MPLMYVPFIMYASWMDFLTRGFVAPHDSADRLTDEEQQAVDTRTRA
jgi:hypothetical protein